MLPCRKHDHCDPYKDQNPLPNEKHRLQARVGKTTRVVLDEVRGMFICFCNKLNAQTYGCLNMKDEALQLCYGR